MFSGLIHADIENVGWPGNEEKQAQTLSLIHCDCDQLTILLLLQANTKNLQSL